MPSTTSEIRRVSRRRPVTLAAHGEGYDLVQPMRSNWHLRKTPAHGKLVTCPSASFADRVLP